MDTHRDSDCDVAATLGEQKALMKRLEIAAGQILAAKESQITSGRENEEPLFESATNGVYIRRWGEQ